MSTILKALRRLEQEREQDAARPLRDEVVFSRSRRRAARGIWGLVGGALVLGFAATWALLPTPTREGSGDEPRETTIGAAATATVASPPPASTTNEAAKPGNPALAIEPGPRSAPIPPATRSVSSLARAPGVPSTSGSPVPEPVRARPAPETAVAPTDDVVLRAPIAGRASRFVDEEPEARSRSAEMPVRVVRTTWHPRAERRTAWIAIGDAEPREVREGEWAGAFEIRTIEPDGILFADGPSLLHRRISAARSSRSRCGS